MEAHLEEIARQHFGQGNVFVLSPGYYWTNTYTQCGDASCPDHLRLSDLGVAGTWRGRLLRLALWLLR